MMIVRLFLLSIVGVASFSVQPSGRPSTAVFQGDGTGGWGIGSSRELTPEEFVRGDRAYFEGFEMKGSGDFMQDLKDETQSAKNNELEELLGVAKIAGLKVRSREERKKKTSAFDVADDSDLDLSVDD